MTDREKVIKEFALFIKEFHPACTSEGVELDMFGEVLALLKEQEAVVHCGDCENFCFDVISQNAGHCVLTNEIHSKNWFCAHGKREEGD